MSDLHEAGILPRFSYFIIRHTEALAEVSHNFPCSLFLFDFDAKRKSRTEKEKHE